MNKQKARGSHNLPFYVPPPKGSRSSATAETSSRRGKTATPAEEVIQTGSSQDLPALGDLLQWGFINVQLPQEARKAVHPSVKFEQCKMFI